MPSGTGWSRSTRSSRCTVQSVARMLKLDVADRGRRARAATPTLVLFTGDPFSPSSRVKVVIVDGKIVYEAP
jgi:hypothetical protein